MFNKFKSTFICCLIGLIVGLTGIIFQHFKFYNVFNIFYNLELKSINSRYELGQYLNDIFPQHKKLDVTIIAIDEATFNSNLKEFSQKTVSRKVLSELLKKLEYLQVATVGFDQLFFKNADPRTIENKNFVNTIKKYKNVILASKQIKYQNTEGYSVFLPFEGGLPESFYGLVNVNPDIDGFIRCFNYAISRKIMDFNLGQEKIVFDKTFDAAIVSKYLQNKSRLVEFKENSKENKYIYYRSPGNSFKIYSLSTFFLPDYLHKINLEDFNGKIVLIGDTQPSNHDYYNVPLQRKIVGSEGTIQENSMPGVEVHANIIQTLLDGNVILEFNSLANILIVSFICIILGVTLSITRSFILATLELLGTIILYSLFVYMVFYTHNLIVSHAYPVLQLFLTGIFSWGYMFVAVNRQKNRIYNSFQKYVSPEIAKIASDNIDNLSGKRKKITVLFTDLADFTPLCENADPNTLIYILNTYFASLGKTVLANKGTIDKYIGDSLMAFWGAPVDVDDHEYLACKTAIEMQSSMAKLNEIYKSQGLPEIRMRIGINTDNVIVGNIGGDLFSYTALGDGVNIASRIEGANKTLGTSILIGENTYESIKDRFICRYIEEITVKGKTVPIKVYELVDFV